MVKRSTVLKIYDIAHVNTVRVLIGMGLLAGGFVFTRVCKILWFPPQVYPIEENADYKTIVAQQNKELLKE